jgi:predicted TIM-barrel fold metal-dependent hydrolase
MQPPECRPVQDSGLQALQYSQVPKQLEPEVHRSFRLQLIVANEVIFKLDQAHDARVLSVAEVALRKELKAKCLGLLHP